MFELSFKDIYNIIIYNFLKNSVMLQYVPVHITFSSNGAE